MEPVISLAGVTKTFGEKVAVDNLDLMVPRGSLCGFIGPNGAGKTTTIRLIMSILFPDRGKISVLGHDSALDAKDRIGYLPEDRGVYPKMKAAAYLRYIARLKGAEDAGLQKRISEWLQRVDLAEAAGKKCEELSKGMQQKVQLLAAIIHEPDLLILDEPFSGLDPVNMRLLRELILEQHERGATVIFSTHVMVQAEELCDHLFMIHDGRKVLDDSLEGIRGRVDTRLVEVEPLDAAADPRALLPDGLVAGTEKVGRAWRLTLADGVEPQTAMRLLVEHVPASRVELHRPSLEDIFVAMVGGSRRGASGEAAALRTAVRDASRGAMP